MPDHEQPRLVALPEAFEDAYRTINGVYARAEDLLRADVQAFESLSCCVFAYLDRDDVFYVNPVGRSLLDPVFPAAEPIQGRTPPIFWLEDNASFVAADERVLAHRRPADARELVTLSWGKTWLEGLKLPILSSSGEPLAILFAGDAVSPSAQIRQVADHYQLTLQGFGDN